MGTETVSPVSLASSGLGQSIVGSGSSPQGIDEQSDPKRKKSKGSGESVKSPHSIIGATPFNAFFNNKVGASFSINDQQQLHSNRNAAALINYAQHAHANGGGALLLPVSMRKVRDSGSLLFMLIFLGCLAYTIWDGLIVKETNVNLIVHGHDSYGNICGGNNRPIQFVDKSGQNYTDKPYTKYTLINSQFERFTLDSSRSKFGELVYVKEQNTEEFHFAKDPLSATEAVAYYSAPSSMRSAKSGTQTVSTAPLSSRAALSATRSQALNSAMSMQLQQPPPLMSSSSSGRALQEAPRNGSQRQQQLVIHTAPMRNPITSSSLARSAAANTNQRHQQLLQQLRGSSTSSSSTNDLRPPELLSAAAAVTTVNYTTTRLATANNESDLYDHVMVMPTRSAHQQPQINHRTLSTPSIGANSNQNQFTSTSQLLYLTECVSACPADHVELIFFRCMPSNWRLSLFPNAINVTRTFVDDILTDLTHCYRELIYTFSLALVLSIGLLILLRFLASIIIWSCLVFLITLFVSMASYSWLTYYYQILDLNLMMPHDSVYADKLAASDRWLIGSVFLTFVAFATIGTVIFMRKRILLVTKLFRESGKAIADMPLLLLQPVLTFAALVAITLAWAIGLICLQSIKSPVIDVQTGFVVFKADTFYKIMKWYHIFAFLWVSHFAIACQHYVIGASVSKWYFSPNRFNLNSPIGASISELLIYYLGSVALGSFLVAIFKVVRIVMRQIQFLVQRNCTSPSHHQHDMDAQMSNGPSSCCGSFSYVWRMIIWFFDNIVMIINRDAYVEVAIHGHSFLNGARRAFTVLASNPLRLLAIKSVSNVLLIVAKICIVFGTVSVAVILLEEKNNQLNYSWSPVVISAIYAYVVAHWFLSVYEMVIDALFICYCEDYEQSKQRETESQITSSTNTLMTQILNNQHIY